MPPGSRGWADTFLLPNRFRAVQGSSPNDDHAAGRQHRAACDTHGRALRDLRISVTDRCNFRCRYCMPRGRFGPGHEFLAGDHLLTFDEISRLARVFVEIGVRKIRLTGGEPLLRPRIERIVRELADCPASTWP